jgi:uncharacterized DUF497 family protein
MRRTELDFEWDDNKRTEVLSQRGIDLLEAALIFEGPVLTKVDARHDYGETRYISLGMVGDECFVVVHTPRKNLVRIITAWLGGKSDKEQYQASIARRTQKDEG